MRAGLADAACLSFESRNDPGHFLRHAGFRVRLNPSDGSALFRNDATFCQRPGLAGRGNSYESKHFPGDFLRVRGTEMWIDPQAGDSTYANAASFDLVDALPWSIGPSGGRRLSGQDDAEQYVRVWSRDVSRPGAVGPGRFEEQRENLTLSSGTETVVGRAVKMSRRASRILSRSIGGLALVWSGAGLAQVRIPNAPDPLIASLGNAALPHSAPERGMWSKTVPWPLIAMHAALTPSGSVLTFGAPPGRERQDGRVFAVWDPDRGLDPSAHVLLPNAEAVDSFCASAAILPSGALLISGGAGYDSGLTARESALFDAARRSPTAVVSQLAHPRWYGTLIALPDGRALMAGGGKPYAAGVYDVAGSLQRGDVSMVPEVYTPGSGWSLLPGAASRDAFGPDFNRWWYPRMWVTPRGTVFGVSSEKTWFLDPSGRGSIRTAAFKTAADAAARPNIGPTSTAVMYDTGRILQVGGNGYSNGYPMPSSARATILDVNGPALVTAEVAPMTHPRQWANATVLPNGRVLVTGGSRYADRNGADAVMDAEIWNPATRTWTPGARASTYRGYHSSAILLPNGTVLTAGGGVTGPVANLNAEIYYPPYLFTRVSGRAVLAPRPALATISASQFGHGATATIELAGEVPITTVALIGLASATHSFDSGQRYQRLAFTQEGRTLRVTMPASAALAPPGYYQIVAVDQWGVPSRGVIVALAAAAPQPPGALRASGIRADASPESRVRLPVGAVTYPVLAPVGAASPPADRLAAAFVVRAGLMDASCVSFESRRYPAHFLRPLGGRLRLTRDDGAAFRPDATFCPRPGLSGRGTSFESMARPGAFLRARGSLLWVDPRRNDPAYAGAASFTLVDALP